VVDQTMEFTKKLMLMKVGKYEETEVIEENVKPKRRTR
jgi:hypothetical protein